MTVNNSASNNVVFFFVSDLKITIIITIIIPRSQCLGQKRENIFCHCLFGEKIIENSLKIDATHLYDNDLLLRLETQKKIACTGSYYNNN